MWAADPCPKFEVPKSAVRTLGLPEVSRPSFDGENQAPVANETTPGMMVSSICKEASQAPLEFQTFTKLP